MGHSRSRSWKILAACALSTLMLALPHGGALVPTTAGAGVRNLLPDMRMAKPRSIRLQFADTLDGNNRRLLRFAGIIINLGEGPLVVKGSRPCATSACPTMTTLQRIRRTDGTWRKVASTATAQFDVGDGHSHWHVLNVERYELHQIDPLPAVPGPLRGAKIGFCFFDTDRWNTSIPRASQSPVYYVSGCGSPGSTSIRMGISVGWADVYPWNIANQWIDTTDLPYGRYLLCNIADPDNEWREINDANNESWAHIELYRDGEQDSVRPLSTGRSACAAQLPPQG